MRSRDLNPEETGRAIMRLRAEQSSDFDFPQLIPVERAAELLYGPTVWTRLLRNLSSAWDNTIDFLHMPVHKIEDFTEGELLASPISRKKENRSGTSPLYAWKSSPTILTEAFGLTLRT
jgi:hypothetical protein